MDVWLWRARFCKSRSLAAQLVESGRIRLARGEQSNRLDKASRTVRPGDSLIFAIGGRLRAIRVTALGARRGPPAEARTLYIALDEDTGTLDVGSNSGADGRSPARAAG